MQPIPAAAPEKLGELVVPVAVGSVAAEPVAAVSVDAALVDEAMLNVEYKPLCKLQPQ